MSSFLMTNQDFQVVAEEYKAHFLGLLIHWVFAGSSIIIHKSGTSHDLCDDVREYKH